LRQTAEAYSSTDADRNVPITRFAELETKNIIHPNVIRTLTKEMGLETMTEVDDVLRLELRKPGYWHVAVRIGAAVRLGRLSQDC
jgi:hypothetical protein